MARGWTLLIVIMILAIAALFGFEYLGRERPQKLVEIPVILPVAATKAS